MPFRPEDIPVFGPDIAELIAVAIALAISILIMVVLGRWWAQ